MNPTNRIRHPRKIGLILALAAMPAFSLLAQPGAPTAAPAASQKKDEILQLETFNVTGSNIKRMDVEKVLPVTVMSRDYLSARDAFTPVDVLTALPQITNVPINESSAAANSDRGDVASINLRGIGSGNSLILLDGRRLVPDPIPGTENSVPSFSINVNQLPVKGISHVDVLRDGASSIYGSDAVAGVVNYIMDNEMRGSQVSMRYALPQHPGGASTEVTITHGRNFAGDRGHILFTIDYMERTPIFVRNRWFSATADAVSRAPAPFNVEGGVYDSRATIGLYPTFQIGNSTTTSYFRPPTGVIGGVPALTNVAPTRVANPEYYLDLNIYDGGISSSRRINWFDSIEYEVNKHITAFSEFSYFHAVSASYRQPNAISVPALNPPPATMSVNNPYNPYGSRFYSTSGAPNSDGTPRLTGTPQSINLLTQVIQGLPPDTGIIHSGTYRIVGGLRGKIFDTWTWETAGLWTRAYTGDRAANYVRTSLLYNALLRTDNTAYNPFGYTFKVVGGAVVPDQPYTNPKSVIDTFTDIYGRNGVSTIGSWDAHIEGRVATLWSGDIRLVIGGEFRKESFDATFLPYVGLNPPNPNFPASGLDPSLNDFMVLGSRVPFAGSRTILSEFAEAMIPLAAPKNEFRLMNSLEITASARHESYSDVGSSTKPKVGLNWKPFPNMMVRGSVNEGFTAPNLTTLHYGTQWTANAPPGIVDPYRNPVTNEGAYITRNYTVGNPNLRNINSKGHTVGMVLDVPKIKGLSLTADYWVLKQDGVISALSSTQITTSDRTQLNAYTQSQLAKGVSISQINAGSGTSSYQGDPSVVRVAPSAQDIATFTAFNAARPASQQQAVVGKIFATYTVPFNLATAYASGVDFGMNYNVPPLPIGRISISSDWAYLRKSYTIRAIPNAAPLFVERVAVDGTTRWRGTATVTLRKGNWSAGLSGYYIGPFSDSGSVATAAQYAALGNPNYLSKTFDSGAFTYRYIVKDTVTVNSFFSYRFDGHWNRYLGNATVRLGVVNVADIAPPLSVGQFHYNTSVYTGLLAGRTWTMEATKSF